jgi:hypothetical protein
MYSKRALRSTILAAGLVAAGIPHLCRSQDQLWRRLLKASEAEQTAWIQAHLRAGMPPSEAFGDLILNRSSVALPLIEQKIEEVLRSPSPLGSFSDQTVDPQKFVDIAALAITTAGDVQALKEASKLMRIDEKRFGWMVGKTLLTARTYRNPFTVAYGGFEIGDPAIDSRIAPWFESQFSQAEAILRQADTDFDIRRQKQWWAEALVEKYRGVPTERQWLADPLASRLSQVRAAGLHDDVVRFAAEAVQKRR